jgi:hypothetical protein
MAASSFQQKLLRTTFILSNNAVFNGANNQLQIVGLRTLATIRASGAGIAPQATIQIYGMKQSDMNALTMLAWQALTIERNTVILEASSDGGQSWNAVFQGQITTSGPDYTAMPDVCLRVEATTLYYELLTPGEPLAYTGVTSVASAVAKLAQGINYGFQNNGVTATLQNPYIPGSSISQMKTLCDQAGVDFYIDPQGGPNGKGLIAITNKGQPRTGALIPTLTPQSGMESYPTLEFWGFTVRSLYNPAYVFGGQIIVKGSDVLGPSGTPYALGANGTWWIYKITHTLESIKLNGTWKSELGCTSFQTQVIATP